MIKKDLLFKIFNKIEYGELILTTPDKEEIHFKGKEKGTNAKLTIKTWEVVDALAFHQELGFCETYIEGKWETPNLLTLTKFVIQNENAFQKINISFFEGLLFWAQSSSVKFEHKKQLKELQLDHNFYQLLLGEVTSHTCGLFNTKHKTLKAAQKHLFSCILENMKKTNKKVLIYGGDWGELTKYLLSKKINVHVYTTDKTQEEHLLNQFKRKEKFAIINNEDTLQKKQFDYILITDLNNYIEKERKNNFFPQLKSLLKQKGQIILHTFISDEKMISENKFLPKYIFPNMWLPSLEQIVQKIEETHLQEIEIKKFDKEPVLTFTAWYKNFKKNTNKIKDLGFDEKYIKMLDLYLTFFLSALETKKLHFHQIILEK